MKNRTYLLKFLGFNNYNLYINNLKKEHKLLLLDQPYDPHVINYSFSWDNTPEGHGFWHDLNFKLELEDEETKERNMLKIMII